MKTIRVKNLFAGAALLSTKGQNHYEGDDKKCSGNITQVENSLQIVHLSSKISSALTAANNANIADIRFFINGKYCSELNAAIDAISQTTTRLAQIAEITLSCGFENSKEKYTKNTIANNA